jgi:hypothetical protein
MKNRMLKPYATHHQLTSPVILSHERLKLVYVPPHFTVKRARYLRILTIAAGVAVLTLHPAHLVLIFLEVAVLIV